MLLDSLRQDIRDALRGFRGSAGFTLVALFVLASGIAANTTIFSVVNAVLLRPLPVAEPDNLRFVSVVFPGLSRFNARRPVPFRTYERLAERRDVFSGIAGFFRDAAKLGNATNANHLVGERVTTGYFDVLGVGAAMGRTFVGADDEPGAEPVIVISDAFWRRRLDADPHVLGRTIDLRSSRASGDMYVRYHRVYTIVGVMPPQFKGIATVWVPSEYWVPLRQRVSDLVQEQGEISGGIGDLAIATDARLPVTLVVRPRKDVTDAQVRAVLFAAELAMPAAEWHTSRGLQSERGVIVVDRSIEGRLPFDPMGTVVPARLAVTLMLVPVMVMLIAASNLAGILMARGVARQGEVGVRLALGAGRARVARQMLIESVLLSAAGGVAAVALSRALIKVFTAYMPRLGGGIFSLTAVSLEVPLDGRVLLFTLALSIATGVFVGMTPALQALRTDILSALSAGANAQTTSPRLRLHRWIVVPQICFSVVLLLAAGVLVRAMLRAELADRGFDVDRVFYVDISMPLPNYATWTDADRAANDARRKAVYLELLQRVRAVPGVQSAALANKTAWTGYGAAGGVPVVSRDGYPDREERWVAGANVSTNYFETMRIPILRGRAFDAHDIATSPPVAVIDEQLAQMLWPGQDPVGEYIASPDRATTKPPTWFQVIGVAKEVKIAGKEDSPTPFLYLPIDQLSRVADSSIVVRSRNDPNDLLKTVPGVIGTARPDAEVPRARTLKEEIGAVLYPARLGATVLALSGLFGLLLSMLGLYGVVSYTSAQRLREIGIRSALGADRHDLVLLLLRDALLALAVAIGCGVALGFAAVRVVSTRVVALPHLDVVTLVSVPLLLSAVILAACLRPVRRAARVNPIDVLRAL